MTGSLPGNAPERQPPRPDRRLCRTSTIRTNPITLPYAMTASDRIVIDPAICHGKPVIRGSRVPVMLVVGSLAGGMTFEEIEREYDLTAEDIRAALKFVGEIVEQESFHPLPAA